ncbi:polar amino acid ABC transporter, inner membrane subunit [Rhizobium sp. CF080]|uniref:amino acid ABC transporter permease n=1 Tax=Rhizobium sp. (strain CF080) TaxID=1144310 RepID=UPI00027178CB|nr:amino acid ABC transporter permease [Rhizobium sp. CF080]EUC00006.1 polar amino acid ABC transporter, inner membrane subunit [Rhizobium sp. CF080]
MWQVFSENWEFFLLGTYPRGPIGGLAMTLIIAVVSLAITFPFAIGVALLRGSKSVWVRRACEAYTTLIRGCPLLMLLLWIYFFLPQLLGFPLSPFTTLVIAIVFFQTAYLSEVIRGGIEALHKGQTEAALALGLKRWMIIWKIILPQALYNVIPGILNQFTSVIKETSLAYVIALGEVTYSASQVNGILMTRPMEVYMVLAALYFVLCFSLTQIAGLLDRRIARNRSAVR